MVQRKIKSQTNYIVGENVTGEPMPNVIIRILENDELLTSAR